jgi:hypothetical protein
MRKSLVYSEWWQSVGSPGAGVLPRWLLRRPIPSTKLLLSYWNQIILSDSDLTRMRHWSRYILSPYFRSCDGRIKTFGGVTFFWSEPELGQ